MANSSPIFIDSHAHLTFPQLAAELPQVLDRARAVGVTTLVTVATDLDVSRQAVELAQRTENVFATVGLHPNDLGATAAADLEQIRALASQPKVVAIGETGLDYFRDARKNVELQQLQRNFFRAHLNLARECRLPVVIHNRSADRDCLDIVREHAATIPCAEWPWGVMHCFSGDAKLALACIEVGLLISYTGILTFKNAATLHDVARQVALDHVMLETDCPYLAPEPHRGQRNEPAYIPFIAAKLAELKNVSVSTIAEATTANAVRLFRFTEHRHG